MNKRLIPPAFLEKTCAIIISDGLPYRHQIVQRLKEASFSIIQNRTVLLTREQASELYKFEYENPLFPYMVIAVTQAPIQVMCLAKEKAVENLKKLMGPFDPCEAKKLWPGSIRANFGDCHSGKEIRNAILGSESEMHAAHELKFFFPNIIIEPLMSDETVIHRYLNSYVYPVLMKGLYELAQTRPKDPLVFLATWLLQNNTYKPVVSETNEMIKNMALEVEQLIGGGSMDSVREDDFD